MQQGFASKKYIHTPRRVFDPIALVLSLAAFVGVIYATQVQGAAAGLLDARSAWIVVGGTFASLVVQFDFGTTLRSLVLIARSFLGTPDKAMLATLHELDQALLNDHVFDELRPGEELTGELLNDVVYMRHQGLLLEEIEAFLEARIFDLWQARSSALAWLQKASVVAPSLGLFGTVLGLIGVLHSLSDPSQIGPSMSLALVTTAYGAGLGSLVFTPLAGRIAHHNECFLEAHRQFMSKVGLLLHREDRLWNQEQSTGS